MFGRRDPQPTRAQKLAARSRRMARMVASVTPRASVMGGSIAGPAPKTNAYRDPVLREMARGQSCLLLVPGVCNHRLDTTVGCHSNLGIHGKAGARKADDCYMVDGCAACHAWLDTGRSPAALKERQFIESHLRQVMRWRLRAVDLSEPERFRRAARRALEHLNATPIPEVP